MSRVEDLQEELREYLDAMRSKVILMPYKGDTSNDSQKVCLMIAMNTLEHSIDGLKTSDLVD